MVVSMAANVAGGVSSASSGARIWMMVNQYQLMLSMLLIDIYIPDNVRFYLTDFKFTALSFDFLNFDLPGMKFIDMELESYFNATQPFEGMKDLGYESGSFISSELGFFKAFLYAFFIYIACLPFILLRPCQKSSLFTKLWNYLYSIFHYSWFITLFLETYLFVLLNAILELYFDWGTFSLIPSYIFAAFCTLVMVFLAIVIPFHYIRYRKDKDVLTDGKLAKLYDGI